MKNSNKTKDKEDHENIGTFLVKLIRRDLGINKDKIT